MNKILQFTGIFFILLFSFIFVVFAAAFVDDTQGEFDAGAYSNTEWNTNHVELSSGQTSGTFTSQVFDGGAGASWPQISWSENLPSDEILISFDSPADVWRSDDNGVTWTLSKDKFDENTSTGDGMTVDSSDNIYIVDAVEVWKSADLGVSWTQVSSQFSDGTNAKDITVETDDDLYIIDAAEDVWRSTDGGTNWTLQSSNINGGSGNVLYVVGVGTTLYAVDVAQDIWRSTDNGVNWTAVNTDFNGNSTNADGLTADSSGNLYILVNDSVWRSTDGGVNWTERTALFGDGTNGITIGVDKSNDNLYISATDDNIWRSTDGGTNWTLQSSNINGGNGSVVRIASASIVTDITFGARSGDTNPPTGSFSGSLTNPSGGDPSVSNAQYFQYKATFSSNDTVANPPELSSVTINGSSGSGGGDDEDDGSSNLTVPEGGTVRPSTVIFAGQASPGSTIEVLRKSFIDQVFKNVPITNNKVKADGTFSTSYLGLIGSDYLFALRVKDRDGRETGIMSFDVNLVSGNLIVENLFPPPTISFINSVVTKNQNVEIVGYAAPKSEVILYIDDVLQGNTSAGDDGKYLFATSTKSFDLGMHTARTRQTFNDKTSNSSLSRVFRLSTLTNPKADFNNDNKINVTDWSVFLFRWGSKDETLKEKIDINGDGEINVADFSIFLKALHL